METVTLSLERYTQLIEEKNRLHYDHHQLKVDLFAKLNELGDALSQKDYEIEDLKELLFLQSTERIVYKSDSFGKFMSTLNASDEKKAEKLAEILNQYYHDQKMLANEPNGTI